MRQCGSARFRGNGGTLPHTLAQGAYSRMARSDFVRSHFDEVEKAGLPLGLMSGWGQKRASELFRSYDRFCPRKRTWSGKQSLQTELQTNHAVQDGAGHYKPGSLHEKCQTRAHG